MKITCQSCQSKYNVADEKVQGKIVKIRCRKCGSTIVVQGKGGATTNGSGAAGGPAAATTEADATQWHVNVGDAEPRTMSLADLVEAYNAGTVAQDTFIWTDGMDDWKPLSEVEAVLSALRAGGAGFEAPVPEAAPSAPALEEPPAYVAPAAYAAPAAMAAAPVEPVEPRRAAVVKRETRARDLFSSGVAAEEVQTSAPIVPQMMSSSAVDDASNKMTGERNENSVLFSLAVLTKDADGRAAEEAAPPVAARNTEDSGLIDLKALALKAESMRPQGSEPNAFASPLGFASAPLGAPLGGVLGGPLGDAPQKSKLPLIIGSGAGIALLLVLGIVIGVKLGGSNTHVPDPSAAMATAAPTTTATAEPSDTASAAPTAEASAAPTASAVASAKPKYLGGGTYHPPGGGAKPTGGGAAAGGTPAGGGATPPPTPTPPKKAGSDCGCNGDLMCLMKCSTAH